MITRPITAILPPEDDEFQGLVVPRQSSRVGASGAGVKLLQVTSPIPRPFLPYAAERTVAGSYTVDTTDQDPDGYIVWNVSGGNATFRLPSAASCPGREIVILRSDNTPSTVGTIVVAVSSADTIAGASTLALNNQYECVTLQSDGNSTWGVVSHVGASSAANPSTQIGVAKVAVTANVSSMSGTGTYDGVGLLVGDVIMLTGQSTGSQNGPWTIQSSNWTRPTWYGSGASIAAGAYVVIEAGTSNGPTIWQLSGSTTVTVDTTDTTWARPGNVVLAGDLGGTASSPTVTKIQGKAWTTSTPVSGQWPYWTGSQFAYADPFNVSIQGQITAVATSNQTLSGLPSIDGINTVDGSTVLLTNQSTTSQNGVWVIHSGAWSRPSWYYSGQIIGYGMTIMVGKGGSTSLYGWSMWMMSSSGSIVVDTNASTWVQVTFPLNALAQGGATNGQVLTWNGSVWGPATGGGSSVPFPTWSSATTYASSNVVQGSDGNLYRSLVGSNLNNNPTTDSGANWCLHQLLSSITLNCGVGQRFADTFAASSSPGGAMTPGMSSALSFIANAVGAVSPSVATITIQQANNPSTTCSAAGSATTVKTTLNIPIGASLVFKGDVTAGLAGATTTVTASSFVSGTYTLTVNALSNAPQTNDTFYYAPYYGTTTVTINLPTIGGNVLVQGSTNTVAATTTEPSLTTATTGGSMPTSTYNASITLSWTDSTGTIRESLPGPITSLTVGSGGSANTLTCAGFTLPTGASGANLYVSNSSGGTLHKQASFSVTGGVASNLTITSYNSGGASAPTTNAPASCWPCACMWGNANGIAIYGARGIQFNGFYLYGPGTSTYNGVSIGSTNSSPAGADTGASVLFGAASVVSNWSAGFTSGEFGSYFDVSSVQIDNCASGCSTFNGVHFRANNINAIRCTTGISLSQFSTGVVNGANVAFCTTGFNAAYGAQMKTLPSNPASGTYQPTYGCTTAANPAFNTQGTAMSYISNS